MTDSEKPIIIGKNRKRAFWSLVIVLFMVPISGWLLLVGLQPGRPEVAWALVLFGVLGLVAFVGSAVQIIRTMAAPWHLALYPSLLALYTPAYDLKVPWGNIDGIAVDEVNRRPGCVLIFGDVAAVAQDATFHAGTNRPDAVTNAATMRTRMEENMKLGGYHMGIPGRLLEKGPQELSELLVQARTGQLWQESGGQS